MRLKKHEIRQRINGNLPFEFTDQEMTGFSGLEWIRRYLQLLGFHHRLRLLAHRNGFCGDYSLLDYVLVLMVLWLCGGRRLSDISYLCTDPLVKRFCGLHHLPSDRSVSRGLKSMTYHGLQSLVTLNYGLILDSLKALGLKRLTLDFDGTVVCCGSQVGLAARGRNKIRRYSKSYFPFLAHIAQTGHFMHVENRPGNAHDTYGGACEVMRSCFKQIRKHFGKVVLETRLDAIFFAHHIVDELENSRVHYVIKTPLYNTLPFKKLIVNRKRWRKASKGLWYFKERLWMTRWERYVEFTIYRKKVKENAPRRSYQYDLFDPSTEQDEYMVLCSNMNLTPKNLLDFYNGRCSMESNIAELKGQFGFDAVPTNHFTANSVHQTLSILTYNIMRNFQIQTQQVKPRKKTPKRTNVLSFQSLKTIRFKHLCVAGRIVNTSRGRALRVSDNPTLQQDYEKIRIALDQWAA